MGARRLPESEREVQIVSTKSYRVIEELIQTRAGIDQGFCKILGKRLLDTGTSFLEPVILYYLTKAFTLPSGEVLEVGTLILADGHHRHHAVTNLPRPLCNSIRAYIIHGTMEEAILAGLRANQAVQDRVITNDDRAHAVKVLLRNPWFNGWSDAGISAEVGKPICSGTIRTIRIRLRDEEGIPIPLKVQCVKNGKPTGKCAPYMQNRRVGWVDWDRGRLKSMTLGREKIPVVEQAKEDPKGYLESIVMNRRKWSEGTDNLSDFREWMRRALVNAQATDVRNENGFGCSIVGDCAVASHGCDDPQRMKARAWEVIAVRHLYPDLKRSILVGYFNGDIRCVKLAKVMTSMDIEFMKPEEFVKEFGVKESGEDQDPAGDS